MNKKGRTRILIVIVAGLWAYNIYRTVENYQVKNESEQVQENLPPTFVPVMFNKDTFDLILPNQDPFLRDQKSWNRNLALTQSDHPKQNNSTSNPVQNQRNNPQANEVAKWPEISYHGFLRNTSEEQKLCLLKIDGRTYKMPVGNTEKEVQIITAFPDSVLIAFHSEKRTFFK